MSRRPRSFNLEKAANYNHLIIKSGIKGLKTQLLYVFSAGSPQKGSKNTTTERREHYNV